MNRTANHRLQVIRMCQCRFFSCSKCTALGGGGILTVGEAVVGEAEDIGEISLPTPQLCCGP